MRIPIAYSLRNLRRRPWVTALTVAGIALVVFAAVLMLALARGLASRLDVTGEKTNLLLISSSGQNSMISSIDAADLVQLSSFAGVAVDKDNRPMISPEITYTAFVETENTDLDNMAPVSVRGVTNPAYEIHRTFELTDGRLPHGGFEIAAGKSVYAKLGVPAADVAVGKKIRFEGREWTIVGVFAANGSLYESELWVRADDLMAAQHRRTYSFVVIRFESTERVAAALAELQKTGALQRLFKGWPEKEYYADTLSSLSLVYWLFVFMAGLVTVAGALTGVNTMYTAVMSRMKEIAMQRVLGFGRSDILFALTIESLGIALAGGVLGTLAGFLGNDLPVKLTQGAFFLRVDALVVALGLALSLAVGVLGALIPAVKGLRLTVVEALRHE